MSRTEPVTEEAAREAMRRDGGCVAWKLGFALDERCAGRLVFHHRTPKGMGGSRDPKISDPENLWVLCDKHHVMAHERRRPEAEEAGIIVRRSGRPVWRKPMVDDP